MKAKQLAHLIQKMALPIGVVAFDSQLAEQKAKADEQQQKSE